MGTQQPGKASGSSAQQIERQLQMLINEALKVLDTTIPLSSANQAEVDSLRSLIWSELTGLEAEFEREGGPRADRVDRFFHHLLSSGDYVGQIEALGSALLGGEPPPSEPAAGSPVVGLHQLHSSLTTLRRQWQQQGTTPAPAQPASPAQPISPTQPVAPARPASPASNGHGFLGIFMEQPDALLPGGLEPSAASGNHDRRVTTPRAQPQPARKATGVERFFSDLGLGSTNAPAARGEMEPLRPRAFVGFLAVFLVVALLGFGVIYLGLNSGPSSDTGGVVLTNGTATIPAASQGTPSPTATLNPAAAQLQVQGDGLEVPCPGNGQTTGFIIQNGGGQILNWSAKVNLVSGFAPVSLSPTSGQLFGGSSTNTMVVTLTALVNTNTAGTITITSNAGTQTIRYQIVSC